MDVSETAILKARKHFPMVHFLVGNIIVDSANIESRYQLIVLSEIIWYLADHIDSVLNRLRKLISLGGILAVKQAFPHCQKYRENIQGELGLLELMDRHEFKLSKRVTIHENAENVMLALFSLA